ncbi:hypothetical protein ACHAXM_008089 [Skeletonema potamos]|jgi:hypothetical protein
MAPNNNEDDYLSSATEIDQLLVVKKREIHHINSSRPLIVASVAALTTFFLVSTVHSEFKHHSIFEKHDRNYTPSKQINALNHLTTSEINAVTRNEFRLVPMQKQKSPAAVKPKTTVCTSQLMIMRHCEKGKQVIVGGQVKETDTTDVFGNRHCNPKGKARSEYIATLFVDTESEKSSNTYDGEASIKPQFPPPLKLYALSEARYKHQTKDHKNFRETESLLPTASKFALTVDKRFGVRDEGDLALDFFETLSKSVAHNVDNALTMKSVTNASEPYTTEESRDICNNGVVVVNWKHSRIPNLSAAFGCGKKEGCPKKYDSRDFDTVWLLTFQYSIEVANRSNALQSHNRLNNSPVTFEGDWKVSAQLVNEGFAYNN